MYVYDGPDSRYLLLAKLTGYNTGGLLIESTSSWMNIIYDSYTYPEYTVFNFTYQIKGHCLPTQNKCVREDEYYMAYDRCNGVWDCLLSGSDEQKGSSQCGSHNGTFLCDNWRCIHEQWTCDQRDDCGDNSDERLCAGHRSSVIFSIICWFKQDSSRHLMFFTTWLTICRSCIHIIIIILPLQNFSLLIVTIHLLILTMTLTQEQTWISKVMWLDKQEMMMMIWIF